MRNLIILGGGGHGQVIADAADAMGLWGEIAFLDDRYPDLRTAGPWPVIGRISTTPEIRDRFADAAVGIGDNIARVRLFSSLCNEGFRLPVVAHPSAIISRRSTIGDGTVILAGAVVNIGASLGAVCILNTGAIVEHDCHVGKGVHISPGAAVAGAVNIGDYSWVGIGATINQCLRVGSNVRIGAGAAVVNNVGDGLTVVGVPARPCKT